MNDRPHRIALALSATIIAHALPAQVLLGPAIGGTLAWTELIADNDTVPDATFPMMGSHLAFTVGGVVEAVIAPELSLLAEPAFSKKGFSAYNGNDHYVFNHLDMALLVRYLFGARIAAPYIVGGPTMGWLLNAHRRTKNYGTSGGRYIGAREDLDVVDLGFARWQTSFNFGAGVSIDLTTSWLNIDLRYQHGFTNVFNDVRLLEQDGSVIGDLNNSDRSLTLKFALMFNAFNAGFAAPEEN